MPSSSKHETCQEQRLCLWFKVAYARLYYSRLHKQASVVTSIYAELLECTQKDLLHSLRDDEKWWDKVAATCQKESRSENVCGAGDCLSDTAACLFEFGRKEEGSRFCEWAEELRNLAIEYYEQEEYEKQAREGGRSYYIR